MAAPTDATWRGKARAILTTWIAAWPTLTAILVATQPFTRGWPLPLRALASATGMAFAMNLVSLPLARALVARLLKPNAVRD